MTRVRGMKVGGLALQWLSSPLQTCMKILLKKSARLSETEDGGLLSLTFFFVSLTDLNDLIDLLLVQWPEHEEEVLLQ